MTYMTTRPVLELATSATKSLESIPGTLDVNCTLLLTNCTGSDANGSFLDARLPPNNVIWHPAVIQRVTTIVVCMLLALVGNTVIILLLTCSRYRKRNSRVNIFIINLAVGDLTVCFCTMTTEILFVAFGQWVLGPFLCKLLPYLQCITLASTTFILTSMSFDRYLAICKPLKYRATTTRAKTFIAMSWILAFILSIPQLLIFVQIEERKGGKVYLQCKSRGYSALWQRMLYFSFLTTYILIIPVILISFCYTSIVRVVSKASSVVQNNPGSENNNCALRRSSVGKGGTTFPRAKLKTLKMTFAIIATFIICWTPYFVTTLIRIYSNYTIHVPDSVMALVESLNVLQSALNPILYGCFNVKLNRRCSELFCAPSEKSSRRSPTYRSPGLCTSLSHAQNQRILTRPTYELNNCGNPRLRDNISNNNASNSSSGNSQDRSAQRGSSTVLTEENKNGVRLRVRFANRDSYKCLSSDGIQAASCDGGLSFQFLQNSGLPPKLQPHKHHSGQQLYT